ncbi:hypothetical protein PCE1_000994 [Barthelona sp. PCE]
MLKFLILDFDVAEGESVVFFESKGDFPDVSRVVAGLQEITQGVLNETITLLSFEKFNCAFRPMNTQYAAVFISEIQSNMLVNVADLIMSTWSLQSKDLFTECNTNQIIEFTAFTSKLLNRPFGILLYMTMRAPAMFISDVLQHLFTGILGGLDGLPFEMTSKELPVKGVVLGSAMFYNSLVVSSSLSSDMMRSLYVLLLLKGMLFRAEDSPLAMETMPIYWPEYDRPLGLTIAALQDVIFISVTLKTRFYNDESDVFYIERQIQYLLRKFIHSLYGELTMAPDVFYTQFSSGFVDKMKQKQLLNLGENPARNALLPTSHFVPSSLAHYIVLKAGSAFVSHIHDIDDDCLKRIFALYKEVNLEEFITESRMYSCQFKFEERRYKVFVGSLNGDVVYCTYFDDAGHVSVIGLMQFFLNR